MKGKITFSLLVSTCLALCVGAAAACSEIPETPETTLTAIELDTSDVKTSYTVGETFTYEGLVVTAVYSDQTTETVTDYTVSSPDMSTEGQKSVTVTYESKTANYSITVSALPAVLESITVDASNAKTTFRTGDEFSYEGLVVTAVYDDESTKIITDYTVSSPDMETEGEKTVTVTYEEKTAEYTINVLSADADPILTGIELDVSSAKLVYRAGDTLDLSELVVKGSYDIGEEWELEAADYTAEADLSAAGEVTVTVTVGEFEKEYTVYVLPADGDVWNTLEMQPQDGSENKLTVYAVSCTGSGNGTPSLTEGWNFFELADGSYRLLPFSCNHLGPDGWWGTEFPANNAEITTSIGSSGELATVYGGVTYTAEENYWHARILDWTEQANSVTLVTDGQLEYRVGDEFNWEVLSVSANLRTGNNGVDITEKCDITVTAPDMATVGATQVEVTIVYTYDDFGIERTQTITEEYTVLVRPDVETVDTIVFDTAANGATLELFVTARTAEGIATGGVILYKSADGVYEVFDFTFEYVSDEKTLTIVTEDEAEWTASFDEDGNLTIANADAEFTCIEAICNSVLLKEEKVLLGIFWNAKREYVAGSQFEFSIERRYSDGSTEALTEDEYTITEPDMTIGVHEVTLTYNADSSYEITFQIYCIPDVNSDTHRLDFGYDTNGSGATLELFVTERSTEVGGWGWADQNTKGWLLVKNTDGTYEMYEYEFYLSWDVQSHPYPNGAPEGLNSYLNSEGNLVIEINEKQFAALNNDLWHLIVIGWQ